MEIIALDTSRSRLRDLYEILVSITAESGQASLDELQNLLEQEAEARFDRRTIYRDLTLINSITNLSVGYDSAIRAYRIALREKLTEPDLKIVINAILSARYDTEDESRSLAEKLYTLGGYGKMPSGAHKVSGRVKLGDGTDTQDKLAFIQDAIKTKRKILFDYQKYTLNKKYQVVRADCRVSPYKILWQNDKLYLVGNYEGNSFSHYRIERICNLRRTKEIQHPISDIIGYGREFDEAEYLSRAIELSRGELTPVEIRFQNDCLSSVFDSLGKDVSVHDNADGTFTLDDSVMLNKKLVRWVLSFGASATVLEPATLREEIAETLQKAVRLY